VSERKKSLLIVDDNPVDREAVVRLLGNTFEIIEADGLHRGLSLFEQVEPSCVLLDYLLPDSNGTEALSAFVERRAAVVLLTGQGNELVAVEAMKLGAQDYLAKKALSRENLIRAIQGAIERRTLNTALQQSRAYSRALLEAIPDIICRLSADGEYIDYIVGNNSIPPSPELNVVGRTLGEVGPEAAALTLQRGLQELFAESEARTEPKARAAQFSVIAADGQQRSYDVRMARSAENEAIAILRDVTEQRDLEEKLRAGQRLQAVGLLAGGISHDFNNILTVIQSYAAFWLDQLKEADPAYADVRTILDAAERAAGLTRQLLAFSRQQVQQLASLSLNDFIQGLLPMLQRLIGEATQIKAALAKDLWLVEADASQIEQVLLNLAINARDAMPEGGTLTLETANVQVGGEYAGAKDVEVPPGEYVLIAVTDTGTGMDEPTRLHLFEPFYTTKGAGKGTGLGLSTAYGIITQSHGFIEVYSEPNHGSTFKIYLPKTSRQRASRVVPVRTATSSGSETILLVEDDEDVRAAAVRILEKGGYQLIVAESGDEALRLFHESDTRSRVQLLLTDVVMPNMLGPKLVEHLRQTAPALPVLYMSGYTEGSGVHQRVAGERTLYLQKPFSRQNMLAAVRQALDQPANEAL